MPGKTVYPQGEKGGITVQKNVLIVGASRPWASAVADALASEARVVRLRSGQRPSEEPHRGGAEAVSLEEAMAAAVVEAAEETGGFDLLLWGPDVSPPAELLLDVEPEIWSAMLEELREVHLVLRCALPYLLGRPSSLVLLGGVPGESTAPPHRGVRCCAVERLGAHLQRELATYGVAVHAWTRFPGEGAPEEELPSSFSALAQRVMGLLKP